MRYKLYILLRIFFNIYNGDVLVKFIIWTYADYS